MIGTLRLFIIKYKDFAVPRSEMLLYDWLIDGSTEYLDSRMTSAK